MHALHRGALPRVNPLPERRQVSGLQPTSTSETDMRNSSPGCSQAGHNPLDSRPRPGPAGHAHRAHPPRRRTTAGSVPRSCAAPPPPASHLAACSTVTGGTARIWTTASDLLFRLFLPGKVAEFPEQVSSAVHLDKPGRYQMWSFHRLQGKVGFKSARTPFVSNSAKEAARLAGTGHRPNSSAVLHNHFFPDKPGRRQPGGIDINDFSRIRLRKGHPVAGGVKDNPVVEVTTAWSFPASGDFIRFAGFIHFVCHGILFGTVNHLASSGAGQYRISG